MLRQATTATGASIGALLLARAPATPRERGAESRSSGVGAACPMGPERRLVVGRVRRWADAGAAAASRAKGVRGAARHALPVEEEAAPALGHGRARGGRTRGGGGRLGQRRTLRCGVDALGRIRGPRNSVATLAGVLLHRLIDEVVDAALELARHLLERFPQDLTTLKCAGVLLIGIRAHRLGTRSTW